MFLIEVKTNLKLKVKIYFMNLVVMITARVKPLITS